MQTQTVHGMAIMITRSTVLCPSVNLVDQTTPSPCWGKGLVYETNKPQMIDACMHNINSQSIKSIA